MVCVKTGAYSFNNGFAQYSQDPLSALRFFDGSGFGTVTRSHLKEFKRLYPGTDFSKFAVTGAGVTDGPGATSWSTIDSTMTNGERLHDLGACIIDVMNRFGADFPPTGALVQFAGGDCAGTLLFGKNDIYAATWEQELNCYNNSICITTTTLINQVQYKANDTVINDLNVEPFDNAKAVVSKALGAVAASGLIYMIATRPVEQPIRQAIKGRWWGVSDYNVPRIMSGMGGIAYIKSKKEGWKSVLPGYAGVPPVVLESELSTNLEKLKKKVDNNELQKYKSAQLPSKPGRFAMLKGLAADLVELAAGFSGGFDNLTVNQRLPPSFIEGFSELKASLFKENPTAYTVQAWDAKIDSYISQFGDAVDVMLVYYGGYVQQLNAIQEGHHIFHPEADVIKPDHILAFQAGADLLSKLAIMRVKLIQIAQPAQPYANSRGLRYAYKTGRVNFNGKRQYLTMVKIKEAGNKAVYVAFNHQRIPFPSS